MDIRAFIRERGYGGRVVSRREVLADAAVAAGLTALAWLQLAALPLLRFGGPGGPGGPGGLRFPGFYARMVSPTPLMFALVAVCFLPLAFRRRFPLAVLAVVTMAAAVYDLLPRVPVWTFVGVIVALYTVGTLLPRKRLIVVSALVATVMLVSGLPPFGAERWIPEFVRIVALVGVAAALGDAARNRQAYIDEVEQRAAEAERTREEDARRRVDEERLRMARELHDVTAHSLSIIAVQSGAAVQVIDNDPVEARKALEVIRQTAKSSLEELRATLGVLRKTDDAAALYAPAPRLSRIDELVIPLEDAGVRVHLNVAQDLGEVPSVVDSSAYRIVQEALTNVVRHAGEGAKATVAVSVDRGELLVEVADNGRAYALSSHAEGHGIAGMRERVAALGGSFEAGPRPDGGFSVVARLPLSGKGA